MTRTLRVLAALLLLGCLVVDESQSFSLVLPFASSRDGARTTQTSTTAVWSARERRRSRVSATEQLDCSPSPFGERSFPLARRNVLLLSSALVFIAGTPRLGLADERSLPSPAGASDSVQPFAPSISNLLPATRVRLWIRRLVALASQASAAEDAELRRGLVSELRNLLLTSPPASFFSSVGDESAASRQYLDVPTLDSWYRARKQESVAATGLLGGARSGSATSALPLLSTTKNPLWALNEEVEQWGEKRQFLRLQREQRALEDANPIRAALNAYTNNLVYGDSAKLTASPQVRRKLIREDQVPDVSTVIRSDLDLRDLYRNQILSAVDDARAELSYQLAAARDDPASIDLTDLSGLLIAAQESCDLWFSFVPDKDAREALATAMNAGEAEAGK